MKKRNKLLSLITLYVIFIFIYIAFFLFHIENSYLFLVLTVGSVAVLSTSTIYTVIQSKSVPYNKMREKKIKPKSKSTQKKKANIIEEYYNAMPLIEKYAESEGSYEETPVINKFIFSVFSPEELDQINNLALSKMEKIQFIREMLYFNKDERIILFENMLNNREKTDEDIVYIPPLETVEMKEQIRVYIRSLVEPGEKTKIIIIDTAELIIKVKERIGVLFNYNLDNFLLSSGGILISEEKKIQDYDIDDDDEIALIPSRK
ncbi:MAG: hypothetical protein ACFFA0_06560 [Promethearchaeota archaeon]